MPLGATSRKSPVNRLGATPYARANARENASVEPYPASKPASVTEPARPTRHAARSSTTRRRNAAGASLTTFVGCRAGPPARPIRHLWEAAVFVERTSVGLDVHARTVDAAALDGVTG